MVQQLICLCLISATLLQKFANGETRVEMTSVKSFCMWNMNIPPCQLFCILMPGFCGDPDDDMDDISQHIETTTASPTEISTLPPTETTIEQHDEPPTGTSSTPPLTELPPETTTHTQLATSPSSDCDNTCVDKPRGTYPNPTDCSRYYICDDDQISGAGQIQLPKQCPSPLLFDVTTLSCREANEATCVNCPT